MIADDHPAVRDALSRWFEGEADVTVVGQAATGSELLEMLDRAAADVAVVDIEMPGVDGLEVCRRLRLTSSRTRIVLYTGVAEPALLQAGLAEDARGFVLKSSPQATLIEAVRAAASGATYLDPTFTSEVLQFRDPRQRLSAREQQVLQLVAQGRTTKAAAAELHLSPTTVRDYVDSAVRKLSAENRTHAVAEALRLRLIR